MACQFAIQTQQILGRWSLKTGSEATVTRIIMRREYGTKNLCADQKYASIRRQAVALVATAASLLAIACRSGRWQIVRTDTLSDGVPLLALYFTDKDHGWAITPGELLKLNNTGEWVSVLSNNDLERSFESLVFTDAR